MPNNMLENMKNLEWNCLSLSVVTRIGTPHRDIHVVVNSRATVSAIISTIGVAFSHLVNRSMQVKQYRELIDSNTLFNNYFSFTIT